MTALLAGAGPARRYAAAHNHDINVTPFVDVMLVLLIVFIIAAPLATTALKLDLPRGGGSATPTNRALVSIDAAGRIFVSTATRLDAPTDLNQLAAALAPLGPAGAAHISVRADQRVRYGQFVSVLNHLQHDGYYKVDLVVTPAAHR